jgi:Uma2 family endonuclease
METTEDRPDTRTDYEQSRDKPLPSRNHGYIQALITGAILRYREEYTPFGELTLQLGDLKVTPDICVYPKMSVNFQEDVVRMTEPPLLAVEIVSPSQSTQDVVDKIRDMLDAGVASCWLVQPATETISIFTADAKPRTVSEGTVSDPATEIEVEIDEIFDEG